jgi:hypothetical protein
MSVVLEFFVSEKKIMKNYHSKSHCKYLLKAHIIFCTKYRKKLLVHAVATRMKEILGEIAGRSEFTIDVMESDKDSGLPAHNEHYGYSEKIKGTIHI